MRPESTPFVKIPLTKGKVALVSPEDAERVLAHKWCAWRSKPGRTWYAQGWDAELKKPMLLHQFLLPVVGAAERDHKNRNGLDNRRSNLRIATSSQNSINMRPSRRNTSGYTGVWLKPNGRWVAETRFKDKHIQIGTFDSAEDAARARDKAVLALHGEFARLNFP